MKYIVCLGAIFCALAFCSIELTNADATDSGYAIGSSR